MSTWPSDVAAYAKARLGSVGPGTDENHRSHTANSRASAVNAGSLRGSKHFITHRETSSDPPGCSP
jgi:hypothetical protein